MQIVSPISVGAIQDVGTTAVSPAAPTAPVAALAGGGSKGESRSDTGERGRAPPRPSFPAPDLDRPAGPPPTFDTTPLELEAERRVSEASAFWRSGAATPEPAERRLDIEV